MLKEFEEAVLVLEEKTKIYEFFANIFAKEPDIEFLKLLQLKDNEEIFKSYGFAPLMFPILISLNDSSSGL